MYGRRGALRLGRSRAPRAKITLNADTLTLGAPFKIDQAVLEAEIDGNGLTVNDLQGRLFGGAFFATGTLSPKGRRRRAQGPCRARQGQPRSGPQRLSPDVSWPRGPFTMGLNIAGEGLSPAGLVAGLNGGGTLFVDPGVLQNLSPAPLKGVARTVLRSRKIKLDKDQIAARDQGRARYAEPRHLSVRGGGPAVQDRQRHPESRAGDASPTKPPRRPSTVTSNSRACAWTANG